MVSERFVHYLLHLYIIHKFDNFTKAYKPHHSLSFDEAMVKFKGRKAIKQYMQGKPVKYGFKMWAM